MALLDKDEVKVFLNILVDKFDDQIEAYIPVVELDIKNFINRTGIDFNDEELYGLAQFKSVASEMIGFKLENNQHIGLTSESINGKYSFSKDGSIGSSGYPIEIESQLIPYRALY